MNKQQFKQKLSYFKITQRILAKELGVSFQSVTNWNAKKEYPKIVDNFFESLKKDEELKRLQDRINGINNFILIIAY